MAGVDAERIGVCSWSYQRPLREVADEMAKIGVKGIDLALTPFVAPDGRHGVEEGEEALAFAKAQFASGAWRLFATMISFPQEDYSTLEAIRKTGGVVPDDCWPRNREIAAAAPDKVELHTFPEAGHGLSYLVDPDRYKMVCSAFLDKIIR